MKVKNKETVSENRNESESLSENKNERENEIENESVSENKNETENETESESESESVSENQNDSESVSENKNESENEIENESVRKNKNKNENEIENEKESVSKNKNEIVSKNENEIERHHNAVQQIQHPFHRNEIERHHNGVQQIEHPFHRQHPLVLVAEQSNLGLKASCDGCGELLSAPCFSCTNCNYHLHKKCAVAPLEISNHPLHLQHPIRSGKSRHQHPFTLFRRRGSFICDACGTEGNSISYICSTCNVMVHKKCTALPRIIKFSRHDHCIFHKYFLEDLTRQDCKICFNEIKLDSGNYSCGKPGCNYIVHVNCVLEDDHLYKVIEEEKQCEELYKKYMQSSIIRVIEVNEAGEATKIEHFSHQHCLVLADKMEEEIDRKCDGCLLSISPLFYYCSKCPFFLHKTCVELPRIKQHWFRQSNAILNFKGFLECNFCCRPCSGFFYNIGEYLRMCLMCAKIADIIECEGHQHFLFFDFKCKEKCNGCGIRCWRGAFRCGKCRFVLDFACLALPHSALHKIDEHMLNPTYDDDKEQSYCDICEQERDPTLWHYSCSVCDTSAHPKCVLGQFSFLNDGITWADVDHLHTHHLKFFRKAKGYLECSYCGKLCQEEFLKCEESTCSYIVHCKCWNY
ncbi:hypothetical protein J1N35_033397 [Gossypium stocksii]|uniref:Phorbol-ester/DAG-type domain-containing protein n=1 Tax=Gossypium stocksii TaxID=47602 RepID=A0A9D3UQ37_9ROSI|nr:hypothetical protein J1N35_033397 [Gossypium stocksii]